MRRLFSPFLIAFMCVSLLATQASGLHLHVNVENPDVALHGTHIHDTGADESGHNHAADIDVLSFETGTGWAKLMPFIVNLFIILLVTLAAQPLVWRTIIDNSPRCHRSCTPPPLRAPPAIHS